MRQRNTTLAGRCLQRLSEQGVGIPMRRPLYEFASSAANNGPGSGGRGDNTPAGSIGPDFVLLLACCLPIVGPVASAGLQARRKLIAESVGTPRVGTVTFGVLVFFGLWSVAARACFPALALGPLAARQFLFL